MLLKLIPRIYCYFFLYQISSWQIPNEVTELKKKQDRDTLKEHSILSTQTNLSTENESAPISLNAPAINTGGRDALALKASVVPGSSSALDLIKKKLQDSGTPVTSSPGPTPSGTAASELNGSRAVDTTAKGLQSENSREKVKDANGDGNMTESSSDSEDADSGPTKEECVIQFKVFLSSFLLKILKVGKLIPYYLFAFHFWILCLCLPSRKFFTCFP